jgi:membrane protein implicated in regulation of membrane protease activity
LRRRLRFAIVILISQILLMALAFSWFIHMILIQIYGSVYFVEREPLILWTEISATLIIIIFGGFVLAMQIRRLGERRENDRKTDVTANGRHGIKEG